MKNSPTLLILAAGLGSRYGGVKHLEQIGPNGECIIDYCLHNAIKAGFEKILFVVRDEILADARAAFTNKLTSNNIEVGYVIQRLDNPENIFEKTKKSVTTLNNQLLNRIKPWGTAHAMLCAMNHINTPFAVINADDLYGYDAFKIIYNQLTNKSQTGWITMIGYNLKKTLSEFGSVSRGVCIINEQQNLISITERKNILQVADSIIFKEGDKITSLANNTIVSMNFWGFHPDIFISLEKEFEKFLSNHYNDNESEFLIPTVIEKLISDNKVNTKVLLSCEQWYGITYPEDKPIVQHAIRTAIANGIYPEKLWN